MKKREKWNYYSGEKREKWKYRTMKREKWK